MAQTMYNFDLLDRRREKFLLWAPGRDFGSTPPQLVLGTYDTASSSFNQQGRHPLVKNQTLDLWELDPTDADLGISEGVYHYWFEVDDTSPESRGKMLVTDPLAYTVDYRKGLVQGTDDWEQPSSVIKLRDGKLWPCDPEGTEPAIAQKTDMGNMPGNSHLVIYELPTSWVKEGTDSRGPLVDVGTFRDVQALFDLSSPGDRFSTLDVVKNEALLADLGINALELLPAADSKTTDEWGYATAHYLAPDFDLGTSSELIGLVDTIHARNIRFLTDVVMAFGHDPYGYINFYQFHLRPSDERGNPDSYQSHSNPGVLRDGYGGQSWRYIEAINTYDPQNGQTKSLAPSWAFHKTHLTRWMTDFGVDGLRLDSVNNIGNWDFVRSFKNQAWSLFNEREERTDSSKFIVIGEELSMPVDMVTSGCLDALWNEPFQGRLRAVILGESTGGDSFEWTVRKMVNCTSDPTVPFTSGTQAINYITSHDVEGYRKERLYNFLDNNGVWDKEKRAKLAFACLMTSVGIPMIFAGEEFCDQQDQPMGKKQVDPVNYARKAEPWRNEVFQYVARLIQFRKSSPALGEDDTDVIHVDSSRGGKIMAWRRGGPNHIPVVVVANFSGEDTPGPEYVVPNWPDKDRANWMEITQQRNVPQEWIGREPLMEWEAKVYTYVV
ncbi:glycoside hydrolase superfamily [Xylariales sp. PMI_506]|nr:glycoside hydrolase superfamily [Xylariales sp. PMI_506]